MSAFTCRNHLRGFTLIEVMLTLSLFVIISLFASPFYGNFLLLQELSVASAEVRGSLSKAQLYSMQSKNTSSWGVQVSNQQIILFRGDTFDSRDQDFDQVFNLHPKITISGLESAIVFAKTTGRPSNTPLIILSENDETESFTLNSEGVIMEQ